MQDQVNRHRSTRSYFGLLLNYRRRTNRVRDKSTRTTRQEIEKETRVLHERNYTALREVFAPNGTNPPSESALKIAAQYVTVSPMVTTELRRKGSALSKEHWALRRIARKRAQSSIEIYKTNTPR